MLDAFAVVKLEIFLYLRFLLTLSRLVDRELHEAVTVAHHLAHQRRVFGGDVLIVEGKNVTETHYSLVKLHPWIHLAQADVAHAMIDMLQAGLGRAVI